MRRRAFSTLLLVVGAALLLMIWAAAQHFVTATARRQVSIAEAGRRCLIAASTSVEEGVDLVGAMANEPAPPDEPPEAGMAGQLRMLGPGDVFETSFRPRAADLATAGAPVRYSEVGLRASVAEIDDEQGTPPPSFTCDKYRRWLVKWSGFPG